MPKTQLDALHSTIAREIKYAKRAMFKCNREGANPRDSYIAFMGNIGAEVANKVFPSKPDHITATLPDGQEVELHGDAVDLVEETEKPTKKNWPDYAEEIETLATNCIQWDNGAQQLALLSLLHEIENAGSYTDMSGIVTTAKYAVFKESIGLHDNAIKWVLADAEENGAEEATPRLKTF